MSDIEFFAKLNPKPFKGLAVLEKERIEVIKKQRQLALLKSARKLPPECEPPETREPVNE